MERVSGVLTQLRASRLQQLTALHEHVRAKVQGLLATLADGEDAVHQLIAAGCTKAAAPSTSETAGKARKASVTPSKRAAAPAPARGSKRTKAAAAAAAAAAPSPEPQAALAVLPTPPRQPAPTAAQQAPPSRELWVKGAGSSSSPLPVPPAAPTQTAGPGPSPAAADAAAGVPAATAADVLQPAPVGGAVGTPAQDAAACPPWSEVLDALSGGKAAGEAGTAAAGAAGRSPRPSRRLPRGASGAPSPAAQPGPSREPPPAASPPAPAGGSSSALQPGSPEVSLCSSPAAATAGIMASQGKAAGTPQGGAAQGGAGACDELAWALPAAQQETASTPCLPGFKADSPPSQQWPADDQGGAAGSGQAPAADDMGGTADVDTTAPDSSPLSKRLRSRASQLAASPLQPLANKQAAVALGQAKSTPGASKDAEAAAAAAAPPPAAARAGGGVGVGAAAADKAPAARPSRGTRAALRVPREPTPPSPASPSGAGGGPAASPTQADGHRASHAGASAAPHARADTAAPQQQEVQQEQQLRQGRSSTLRAKSVGPRLSAVAAGNTADAAAAAAAAPAQAAADPPAAPVAAAGDAATTKDDTVLPPAAMASAEQRSFGNMLNRLAAGGSNLVSGVRSLLPSAPKRPSPTIAAGKVKTKVKALEEAEAVRKREAAKAEERARAKAAAASAAATAAALGGGAAASHPPAATTARAVAGGGAAVKPAAAAAAATAGAEQAEPSSSAHADGAAPGRSEGGADGGAPGLGSGGAQRVLVAPRAPEACKKPADREARQKRVEKEAEAARRALDRTEREERQRRAEAKRKAEEAARRAALEGRARAKEARPVKKPALGPGPGAAPAAGGRGAAGLGLKPGVVHKGAAGGAEAATFKSPAPKPAAHMTAGAPGGGGSGGSGNSGFKTPGASLKGAPQDKRGVSPTHAVKLLPAVVAAAGGAGAAGSQMAATPKAPEVTEQDKRNIEILMASPYVDTAKKRTPKVPTPGQPSYDMSPYRPDDDDDTPDRSHKQVPDWARGPALRAALVAQHCMDPELVFGVLKNASCDLVEMFKGVERMVSPEALAKVKAKKRPYTERGDSAVWAPDKLSWEEEIAYKKSMKYFKRPKALV